MVSMNWPILRSLRKVRKMTFPELPPPLFGKIPDFLKIFLEEVFPKERHHFSLVILPDYYDNIVNERKTTMTTRSLVTEVWDCLTYGRTNTA